MKVYFLNVVAGKLIDLGPFGKSGMDVSPMDIPLKGDKIADDYGMIWEVEDRQHYWTGVRHEMTLHLKQL